MISQNFNETIGNIFNLGYLSTPILIKIKKLKIAGWSSLVARWAHNPKVGGSNPSPATTKTLLTEGFFV